MQIVLFEDKKLRTNLPRDYGKLKKNPCKIANISYSDLYKLLLKYPIDADEIDAILTNTRSYKSILGLAVDSHYLIEYLGLGQSSREFILEINLQDRLDLILFYLTGCSMEVVRNIPNYEQISRILLTLDSKNLNIPLGVFIGINDNLDRLITECMSGCDDVTGLMNFLTKILRASDEILVYLGFYLQKIYDSAIFRSISRNSIILTSYKALDIEAIDLVVDSLMSNTESNFIIPVKEFKRIKVEEVNNQ